MCSLGRIMHFLNTYSVYLLLLNLGLNIEGNAHQYQDRGNNPYYRGSKFGTAKYGGNGVYNKCGENIRITRLTEPGSLLEDPFYDKKRQSVLFIDSDYGKVLRYEINTKQLYSTIIGNGSCHGIIPLKGQRNKFHVQFQDESGILTWDGISPNSSLQIIEKSVPKRPWPYHNLDEAKVGPSGAIFFYSRPTVSGSLDNILQGLSTFYNIINGRKNTLVGGFKFGNGVGYNSTGRKFYFADSILNVIYSADFDPRTNKMTNVRPLLNFTEKEVPGSPDSMTVDKDGYIWQACNSNSSRILQVNPNSGEVMCSFEMPARSPTNLAFTECPGKNDGKLNCMVVTSMIHELPSPATFYDGALYFVEGLETQGVLPYEADYDHIWIDPFSPIIG